MSSITQDLQSIKTVEDTLTSNKVARFAYTQQAYTNNDANGVTVYNPNQEQNIPVADASVMKVNSSILNLGWRAQASALTRMLMNHFLGRISYNLNKVNDNVSAILSALIAKIGQAEGIATLDANGHVPYSQLPEGTLVLKGYWNASTNTPTLADGTGTSSDFYFVEVAGTQDLGSGEQYFAVGDKVLYDGSVWKNASSGFIRKINNQVPDIQGNKTLTVGNNSLNITKGFLSVVFGRLLGRVWHQGTGANTSYRMQYLVYANGLWVCGSYGHGMWWSEDGKSWTQGTGADSACMQYLVYANGLWVCGSEGNGMWWSKDGKSWTQGTGANTSHNMRYLVYANGLWVCCSYNAGVWYSEDGKSWSQGTGANTSHDMRYLVYANGLWVCCGYSSGMWCSEDGKSWSQGSGANTSYNMSYLVYVNGLWVCCSEDHGVWYADSVEDLIANGTIDFGQAISIVAA